MADALAAVCSVAFTADLDARIAAAKAAPKHSSVLAAHQADLDAADAKLREQMLLDEYVPDVFVGKPDDPCWGVPEVSRVGQRGRRVLS